jgi:hypothetical protein
MHGFAFLFSDVFLNHFVGQVSGADGKVSPCSKMTSPELFLQMWELLKEYPRTDALQPLYDHAHVHVRPVRYQHVNVVACDFPGQDGYFVFHGYLPYDVAHTKRHLASEYLFPIFRDPHKVYLEVVLRVRA